MLRDKERETARVREISHLLGHLPNDNKNQGCSMRESGSGDSIQVFHVGGRDHRLLPLRICICRKLESVAQNVA